MEKEDIENLLKDRINRIIRILYRDSNQDIFLTGTLLRLNNSSLTVLTGKNIICVDYSQILKIKLPLYEKKFNPVGDGNND